MTDLSVVCYTVFLETGHQRNGFSLDGLPELLRLPCSPTMDSLQLKHRFGVYGKEMRGLSDRETRYAEIY